jgi:beta-amylase
VFVLCEKGVRREGGVTPSGHGGPHDAGHYNSRSWETGFFKSQGGRWQGEYGHFFQSWYRCVGDTGLATCNAVCVGSGGGGGGGMGGRAATV